ncbi:MAG: Ig-like domain-containing protein, partial [Oscillospiraceae bacterium]|nr:Ig-like domain-containing protein [Oscillospiraceae bacterium]
MKNRILSSFVALTVLLSLLPSFAAANEDGSEQNGLEQEQITVPEMPVETVDAEDPEENIEAPCDHDWAAVGDPVAPTCTQWGYTVYVCSVCEAEKQDDLVEPLGHTWDDGNLIAPTCIESGCTVYTCTVCGETVEDDFIDPDPDNHVVIEVPEIPATETETGLTAGTVCSLCGVTLSGRETIPVSAEEADLPEQQEEEKELREETPEGGTDDRVRSFAGDVITGFADLPFDSLVLPDKPVLMVLKGQFPEEITVLLGGTVTYAADDALNPVPEAVDGAEQRSLCVDWICEQDYDEDLEAFTFIPVLAGSDPDSIPSDGLSLAGFALAPGLELPRLSVQVGEIVDGPVSGYIPTGLTVPWVGSGMRKGAYFERYVPIEYDEHGVITSSLLPPLRDQGMEGTCWAHSAIGSIEADLIHDGLADETIDLSELYLSYYVAHCPDYPSLRIETGDRVTSGSTYLKNGGNSLLALRTMANGAGPVSEAVAPYYDRSSYSPAGTEPAEYQLTRAYLMAPDDIEAIKAAILMHFGVDAGIYYSARGGFFSSTNNSYYYSGTNSPNHSVMLVGWDDGFSRMNFVDAPDGDGAWLVRNSWASEEYQDTIGCYSYFWISYYDAGLLRDVVTAYDVERDVYNYCYAYDTVPYPSGILTLEPHETLSQTYTIKENEVITAVGFETKSANLELAVSVRVGTGSPVVTHAWTTCAGFYLISLSKPVSAAAGSSVTVTLDFSTAADVAIEWSNDSKGFGSTTYYAALDSGGCKTCLPGSAEETLPYDARLKLYTVPDYSIVDVREVTALALNADSLVLTPGESEQLTALVTPENASNKDLSWISSDPSVVRVDNGLVIGVSPGTSRITVTSRNGKSTSCDVTVVDVRVTGVYLSEKLDKDPNDPNQKYTLFNDDQFYPLEESGCDIDLSTFSISYSYTVVPSNASNKKVTWSSSDPSVISVNASNGECRLVGNGESVLTVTTQEGSFSDSVRVQVALSTYAVSYNTNGGSGALPAQTKCRYLPLALNTAVPTRPGYTFVGWSEDISATTAQYQPGGRFTKDASVTLYAVWKANTPPKPAD